jgi:hypothetical protein
MRRTPRAPGLIITLTISDPPVKKKLAQKNAMPRKTMFKTVV